MTAQKPSSLPLKVLESLDVADDDLDRRWRALCVWAEERFQIESSTEAFLFLIGLREAGGKREKLDKDRKQELVFDGVRAALNAAELTDSEGKLPDDDESPLSWRNLSEIDQEKVLRIAILAYFDEIIGSK